MPLAGRLASFSVRGRPLSCRGQLGRVPRSGRLSDLVILLHREDAYNKDERPCEADFIVAEHRDGETKTITAAFHWRLSRFVDMQKA